jgi:hypothetical protein
MTHAPMTTETNMQSTAGTRLSPRQRHLWALLRDAPAAARDARALLRLRGPLDADALRAALDALVLRHEVLRAAFEQPAGTPEALQVAGEGGIAHEEAEYLAALPAGERDARIEALWTGAAADGRVPAARLVRTGPDEHLLLVRLHPLSVDAPSWESLAAELAALYAAERGGAAVEGDPVPYAAVADWLNEVGTSADLEPGRAWWARQWAGTDPVLPLERGSRTPSSDGVPARRTLSAGTAEALRQFADSAGAPVEAVLLAAWVALLHRLGGTAEVRVAAAVDGRVDDELAGAVGPFAEHVPLTVPVEPGGSFARLVERVRDGLNDAAQWLECFDAEALRSLAGGEGAGPRMGFGVLPAAASHAGGGIEVSVAHGRALEDPFALHLRAGTDGADVALELAGDESVPHAERALFLERLESLLADALARPQAPVSALAVMSPAEAGRVLREFNASDSPAADGPRVHERIAAQAARTPAAPAVTFAGATLSYGELDARANGLAQSLRVLGVGPEVRVGLMLERAPEMVVAVLAVLKAGGAYVPLDPGYPRERLAYMLADARVPVLLTQDRWAPLAEGYGGTVLYLDREWNAITAGPAVAPRVDVDPDGLAYMIYTSGSTGRPKGAMNTHRGIANRLA